MKRTEDWPPDDPGGAPAATADRNDALVMRAVEEYRAALRAGHPPNRQEFLARHAQIGAFLAECLDALDFLDAAAPGLHTSPWGCLEAASAAEVLPGVPLGDYRILREVGRGGMGVVYEAEQLSLGRRVALKVLPFAAALDSKQLQRFKNEAQAAAHLQHQNIVPVHAVGCERGVHYYAMQFIEGQTLAALIAELRVGSRARLTPGDGAAPAVEPQPPNAPTTPVAALSTERSPKDAAFFRTVATLGTQAAQALEHAHQLGVVHRDVKPANLLVDVRGNLWITDFGLAHCQSQAGLTLTGDLVGTLRYMSPEQALAKRAIVDHRTDVYSLGATLYELLTLEPAFGGRDREELLRQIAFEEPPSPRQRNAAVPTELATIVLKALEKNPGDRYGTAQELANDLHRFLNDEPIRARPPTRVQRLRKWARRHHAVVVTSGIAAAVLLVAALVAVTVGLLAVERERLRSDRAYVEEARRRRQARDALDRMTSLVLEDLLAKQPVLTEEHRKFLRQALEAYEEFAAETGPDEQVRVGVARAYRNAGRIRHRLEPSLEAAVCFRRAAARYAELAAEFPARPIYRQELAGCYNDLGALLNDMGGRLPEALAAHADGLAICKQLVADFPGDARHRHYLADNYLNMGNTLMQQGRLAGAETMYRDAVAIEEALVHEFADVAEYREMLLRTRSTLSSLLALRGQGDEALALCRSALTLAQGLAAEFPAEPRYRHRAGMELNNLANRLRATGRPHEVEDMCRQTVTTLRQLVAGYPAVPTYREDLAKSLLGLGLLLTETRRHAEGLAAYREAGALVAQLVTDLPEVVGYRHLQGTIYNNMGLALAETAPAAEAERAYGEALGIREQLAAKYPANPGYQQCLASTLVNLAGLRRAGKDFASARALLERARPFHEAALKASPRNPSYRWFYRNNRRDLAANLLDLGDHAAAAVAAEELVRAAFEPGPDLYSAAGFLARAASAAENDGRLPADQRRQSAQAFADRAVALLRQAAAQGYREEKRLQEDKALDPLRPRPDFQELLAGTAVKPEE
jgi:serine/threonine protein kinase/tetratricopeptide (TPR) repeat protein